MLFFYSSGDHRDLHSFPTRRSSDLAPEMTAACPVARSRSTRASDAGIAAVRWRWCSRSSVASSSSVPEVRACTSSARSEEHTSELQSQFHLVCRLLLEKKKTNTALP